MVFATAIRTNNLLEKFFSRIKDDPCVGLSHIALFIALLHLSQDARSVLFFGREVRALAKINSPRTYFKLMKDLNAFRYIEYKRGSSRWEKSRVDFCL